MKKTWTIGGLFILVLAVAVYWQVSNREPVQPDQEHTQQTQRTTYAFTADESGTAFSAMQKYARTAPFEFKTKEFEGLGIMVEEINGLRGENGYYWILYINGKTSEEGASKATVKPGDVVEWRYEKGY